MMTSPVLLDFSDTFFVPQIHTGPKNFQPDDSSYDEILKELAFHRMIEHGHTDS
jgi:hypothetical protein